jgi:hypothetical protein
MNLVHMLIEIQQRKARMDALEELQRKAALTKQYEELLAQLSMRATRMIEESYAARSTEIDPAFSKDGLDVLPPFNEFLRKKEDPIEWVIQGDAQEAWDKFADGWRKAAIKVQVVTLNQKGYIRFTPISR